MKSHKIPLRILLSLVVTAVALAGCASIPKVTSPTGVDVLVSQMSLPQIRSFYGIGVSGDLNPFLPPGSAGLLHKQKMDFIVLKISVASARDAVVTLDSAVARDAHGNDVADLYTFDQFQSMLQANYQSGPTYQQVYGKARNAYLNPFEESVRPGRTSSVVVLVGKHPLPLPVTVDVHITVGVSDQRSFTVHVTSLD